jgi:hypothetical protein
VSVVYAETCPGVVVLDCRRLRSYPGKMTRRSGSGAYRVMRRFAWQGVIIALPALPLLAVSLETRGGLRLLTAIVAIALLLLGSRRMALGDTWERGADNERRVGKALERLRADGWLVVHDLPRDYGNIDHIACGRNGIYTIETKSRRYDERKDLNQAWGHARWLSRRLGIPVSPLLCIVERDLKPHTRRGVHILPLTDLSSDLQRQPMNEPGETIRRDIVALEQQPTHDAALLDDPPPELHARTAPPTSDGR